MITCHAGKQIKAPYNLILTKCSFSICFSMCVGKRWEFLRYRGRISSLYLLAVYTTKVRAFKRRTSIPEAKLKVQGSSIMKTG